MNFPSWAPQTLIEIYHNEYEPEGFSRFDKGGEKILIALTTHADMKRVWKMLYKERIDYPMDSYKPRKYGDEVMEHDLFRSIQMSIMEAKKVKSTKADNIKKYLELAKLARTLSEKIKDQTLDHSPFNWLSDGEINIILERDINPDKADGYFCLVNDESEFHKKGGIYKEVKFTDKESGKPAAEAWRMYENTHEFFNKFAITPRVKLSDILKDFAESADIAAKQSVKTPHNDISTKTLFIRSLYPFWIETFRSPLYGTFASLCRVVLDDENIGREDIQAAIKSIK
jgi:hypothetical protein